MLVNIPAPWFASGHVSSIPKIGAGFRCPTGCSQMVIAIGFSWNIHGTPGDPPDVESDYIWLFSQIENVISYGYPPFSDTPNLSSEENCDAVESTCVWQNMSKGGVYFKITTKIIVLPPQRFDIPIRWFIRTILIQLSVSLYPVCDVPQFANTPKDHNIWYHSIIMSYNTISRIRPLWPYKTLTASECHFAQSKLYNYIYILISYIPMTYPLIPMVIWRSRGTSPYFCRYTRKFIARIGPFHMAAWQIYQKGIRPNESNENAL